MAPVIRFANLLQDLLDKTKSLDFLGPLALRLYLAPIMLAAGFYKMNSFDNVVLWFEHSLGLPLPWLMAFAATATEIVGGFALLFGVALRWFAIPLMVTMFVAGATAHWDNGWFAIAPSNPDTSTAVVLEKIGFPGAKESLENSAEVGTRLRRANSILEEHGNHNWLSEKGRFVVLNDGIELAATYFIMLLVLFFTGAGRYLSVDYWIHRKFRSKE